MEAEPEALVPIARHATGALRDGLSLLEQVAAGGPVAVERVQEELGLAPEEGTLAVLEAVAAGDVGEVLSALAALLKGGADARVVRRQPVGAGGDRTASFGGAGVRCRFARCNTGRADCECGLLRPTTGCDLFSILGSKSLRSEAFSAKTSTFGLACLLHNLHKGHLASLPS
ncbi:MAG: hypothetical protein JXA14_04770 [Anaerolineae bacterium]|nr:hypothetical protein [Anaerolineae bacterium]